MIDSANPLALVREAHRKHISSSDMPLVLAKRGTKRYAELVDRLVLDFEGHPLHTDEFPEPWVESYEAELAAGRVRYRTETNAVLYVPGFVQDRELSWLGATPHALVDEAGVLWVRVRKSRMAWWGRRDHLRPPERARVQILLRVTGRQWCDVADFWSPDGTGLYDKISIQRVVPDPRVLEKALARCTAVFADVSAKLFPRIAESGVTDVHPL